MVDFGSKVNAMTPAYVAKLGFTIRKTNVGAQKIDYSPLEIHDMASMIFSS